MQKINILLLKYKETFLEFIKLSLYNFKEKLPIHLY